MGEQLENIAGKLLIAEPFLSDINFKRAVILVCEHHVGGTTGFVINRKLNFKINELLIDLPTFDADVYYGGPVDTNTIHYLHRVGDLVDDALMVAPGLYWGGNYEDIKLLIKNELLSPQDIKFFVGYTGWEGGQLLEEFEDKTWLIADFDPNYIFKNLQQDLWSEVLNNKGNTFSVIAQIPDTISQN